MSVGTAPKRAIASRYSCPHFVADLRAVIVDRTSPLRAWPARWISPTLPSGSPAMNACASNPRFCELTYTLLTSSSSPQPLTRRDGGEEFPLVQVRVLEGDIGRHVLDEQPHAEEILGFADLPREQFDGFIGVWQRQQIVEEFTAGLAPAGVFGYERRLETRDGAFYARQVLAIDAVGGAQPQADAMQAQRVVSARAFERAPAAPPSWK